MKPKLHIKKGDTVYVNAGEYKGEKGRVLKVLVGKYRAIVEGINLVYKHKKPTSENAESNIVKMEAPIHLSNLQPICPDTGKPTKIGRKLNDEGNLVRYSKKSKNKVEIK